MKITVKQSSIVVEDYKAGDAPFIERSFTLYDELTHQTYTKGIDYNPDTGRLILPRGVDISWVEEQIGNHTTVDYRYDRYDAMLPDRSVGLRYRPRNERQVETIKFMIGKDRYSYTKAHSQLSVNNNTGEGKTWACISTACFLNIRSIVITSNTNWLEQWRTRILEYTDLSPKQILFLVGSASINKLLREGPDNYCFILASHSTLASYAKTNGWEAVGELFKFMKVGLKFYDEAHLFFDNMCYIDFYTNTYKTYYVSATPARSDKHENVIYGYYFRNVPSICLFDQNTDPHTSYTAMIYNSKPTPQQISDCKGPYGLDRNKYTNYVVKQENFYLLLHIIMINYVMHTSGKTLMYVGTNSAIEIVKQWLEEHYPMFTYGVYTSVITNNKSSQLDKRVILSTTKSAGAAMDIAGLELTVVLAEQFKSEVLARQTLGRTRASDTRYIDIVDNGFHYTRKYYEYKRPIFDKYATSCEEERYSHNTLAAEAQDLQDYLKEHPFPFQFI